MMRLANLAIVLASALMLVGSSSSWAAEEGFPFGPSDEMRGMLVLRLPFGRTEAFGAPRLGLDLHMNRQSDLDRLEKRYDTETGGRVPEVDAGSMRTWSLDPKDYVLPEDVREEFKAATPSDTRLPRG